MWYLKPVGVSSLRLRLSLSQESIVRIHAPAAFWYTSVAITKHKHKHPN